MNDVRTPKKHSSLKLHRELNEVWSSGTGFRRLAAVNHTVIGKRFMVTALVFFAIGGFLGMLIRTQLATSSNAFMDAEQYAQVFTMHGTIMMFLFAIPFFEGLSIYVLPKLIGARDLAFPRLSAYGYWCYLFGGGMLIFALIGGAAPAGLVHVHAAVVIAIQSRDQCRHLASRHYLRGDFRYQRGDRNHRDDPEVACTRHVPRQDAGLRLVHARCRRDDADRFSAADPRFDIAGS